MRPDPYRIPERDCEILVVPPLEDLPAAIRANQAIFERASGEILSRDARDLRAQARRETFQAAIPPDGPSRPWQPGRPVVMSGHQPEFLHPGIWLKNHLAGSLARRSGGAAIHLVVDSDTPDQRSIHYPEVSGGAVRIRKLRYLEDRPGVAYEEFRLDDGVDFEAFRLAAADGSTDLRIRESLEKLLARLEQTPGTPFALLSTRLRRSYESEFGLRNYDVLLSRVSETPSFRHFFLHLLQNLESWREAYNAALESYRKLHRIRSPANPLPNLEENEMPFWVWGPGQPREPLFIRMRQGCFQLLRDRECLAELCRSRFECEGGAVETLAQLGRAGIRLRPRALVTTTFCRLFLSDLFIHGVGGARYDTVTNEIIERFFGCPAPAYVAASGTFHLPVEAVIAGGGSLHRLRYRARDVHYNPERYAPPSLLSDRTFLSLVDRKRSIYRSVGQLASKEEKQAGFLVIKAINQDLAARLGDTARRVHEELDSALSLGRQQAILEDRSYPFFLFPQEKIAKALRQAGL